MAQTVTFTCKDCRHVWDTRVGMGRPDACPKCKSTNLRGAAQDHQTGTGRSGLSGSMFSSGRGPAYRGRAKTP